MTNLGKLMTFVEESKFASKNESASKTNWQKSIDKEHLKNQSLTVAAFSLSEIEEKEEFFAVLEKLWAKTADFLVLVEAGEPHGFKRIRDARNHLLKKHPASLLPSSDGASVVAPCSHDGTCPLTFFRTKKWCHFGQKIPVFNIPRRSSLFVDPANPLKRVKSFPFLQKSVDADTKNVQNNFKNNVDNNKKNNGENNLSENTEKTGKIVKRRQIRNSYEHIFRFSYVIIKKGKSVRRKLEDRRAVSMLRGPSFSRKIFDGFDNKNDDNKNGDNKNAKNENFAKIDNKNGDNKIAKNENFAKIDNKNGDNKNAKNENFAKINNKNDEHKNDIKTEEKMREMAYRWGRIIDKPMKKKGHVILKLCSDGEIETRVVTKSFGQKYKAARHSRWGDLWPHPLEKVETAKTAHRRKFAQIRKDKKLKQRMIDEKKVLLVESAKMLGDNNK